jgi:hypothetical protein
MKIANSLAAVFGIPFYALLLCHPSATFIAALAGRAWWDGTPRALAALLVCADGAWLVISGSERRRRFGAWIAAIAAIALVGAMALPEAAFLTGLGAIFSVMRVVMLRRDAGEMLSAFATGAIGFGLAVFLVPVSLWMAITAFLLVSWIDGVKGPDLSWAALQPDRFRDGERLARKILGQAGL